MPELGPRVARTGVIGTRAGIAMRAVRKVLGQARAHGYDELIACATQAVRQASDGVAFVREASAVIGVPVRIISARREAALSFLGAASRHAVRREWALVDLGGGSTEIVIARGRQMLRSAALPIGSGLLPGTYLSDPPKPEERARLRKPALRELTHAPDGEVERLVATGGTASNLPQVLARRNPPAVLTTADLLVCEARLDVHRPRHVAAAVALLGPAFGCRPRPDRRFRAGPGVVCHRAVKTTRRPAPQLWLPASRHPGGAPECGGPDRHRAGDRI